MPEFAYTARTLSGQDTTGTLNAGNKREALAALAERSMVALRVEVKRAPRAIWRRYQRIKPRLVATNLGQLADLLQHGVPLLTALGLLAEQATTPVLAEVLRDVRDRVADGMALDRALERHPQVFGELTVSMIHAGVEGAFLEDALRRTADFLEREEELKARLVGAMTYPAFLALVGLTVTTVLIVFFVPRFASLFTKLERAGHGLPWATVTLLSLSYVVGHYWLLLSGAVLGAVMLLRRGARSSRGRLLTDRWKLHIPVAGTIFLGYAVSRFLPRAGNLVEQRRSAAQGAQYQQRLGRQPGAGGGIRQSAENVSWGNTLSKPLAGCGLIPRPVMAMIRIAEESNNLDQVLVQIADTIDRNNARNLDMMVRLVEPMMLIVMGGMIMFVIVALLLPVFDIGAALGS